MGRRCEAAAVKHKTTKSQTTQVTKNAMKYSYRIVLLFVIICAFSFSIVRFVSKTLTASEHEKSFLEIIKSSLFSSIDNQNSSYESEMEDSFREDGSLNLVPWTKFSENQTFVNRFCQHQLNMDLWNPGEQAQICLFPLHHDVVRFQFEFMIHSKMCTK